MVRDMVSASASIGHSRMEEGRVFLFVQIYSQSLNQISKVILGHSRREGALGR